MSFAGSESSHSCKLHYPRKARRSMRSIQTFASSNPSGMQRQQQKGTYSLRHIGPAPRGFSGESPSCSARCSSLYASALELARSQVFFLSTASCISNLGGSSEALL